MLRYFEYSRLIEKLTADVNINLYGNARTGKTFTVKECLLKDITIENIYLDLEYPFDLDRLFQIISMSFGLYYQLDWPSCVQHLSINPAKLLVIDNFDRLHCAGEKFVEDLFVIAGLIAYTYQDKKPSLNLTTQDLNLLQEDQFLPSESLALTII